MDEMMEQHLEEVQVAKSTRAVWLIAGEQSTIWENRGSEYIDWSG
jgi:acetylornithine/succinyldiaminopimelate/putrescine aminotransferase